MGTIAITAADRVFVLTGAGVSAESGLPTFRASDGLWAGNRIEDVCTPEAWERNPWRVWEFYSARRAAGQKAAPNSAHFALAELEARLGNRSFCVRKMWMICMNSPAPSGCCTCMAS